MPTSSRARSTAPRTLAGRERFRRALCLGAPAAVLLLGACASAGVRAPAAATDRCTMVVPASADSATLERASGAGSSIAIALTHQVELTDAPWPRNAGEQLLFAQLYETLVRVDCTGRPTPGLAGSWKSDPSGRQWTFVLRDGATFSNGEPATAGDVKASWEASAAAHRGSPAEAIIATIANGASVLDSRTLAVTLPDAQDSPRIFAAPELAVSRPAGVGSWPYGTTSYHVAAGTAAAPAPADSSTVALEPSSSDMPRLLFRASAPRDERDLIDDGVEFLVARSPSVAQYASTQRSRAVIPLPWSRTYVALLPERVGDGGDSCNAPLGAPGDALAFRSSLGDAVHADARGAEPPFWWSTRQRGAGSDTSTSPARCPTFDSGRQPADTAAAFPAHPAHAVATGDRIVYLRGDAVARDLAERLVALAAPARASADSSSGLAAVAPEMLAAGRQWRAIGLDSLELARALASGSEPAYILALPRRVLAPSLAMRELLAAAPWLRAAADAGVAMVPLVDTRQSLIARRALVPRELELDWVGTLRFAVPPEDAAETAP